MENCAKCATPLGDDAVLLKNGEELCPQCFNTYYAEDRPAPKPERHYISVELVIGVVVVLGVSLAGYKIYSSHVKSEKLAAAEIASKQDADIKQAEVERLEREAGLRREAENRKRRTELATVEEKERLSKEAADAAGMARLNEIRIAADKRRLQEAGAEAEKKWKEEQAQREAAIKADAAKEALARESELRDATKIVREQKVLLARAEADKADTVKKIAGWKTARENLMKLPDVPAKRESVQSDIAKMSVTISKMEQEIAVSDSAIDNAALRLKVANSRIEAINPTPAELARIKGEPGVAAVKTPAKAGSKRILLKNGTVLNIKSYIDAGDSISYKGEDNQFHTVEKSVVDKIDELGEAQP